MSTNACLKKAQENKERGIALRKVEIEISYERDLIFSYRQTRNFELYLLIHKEYEPPLFRVFFAPHSDTYRLEKLRGVDIKDRKRLKFDDLVKEIKNGLKVL